MDFDRRIPYNLEYQTQTQPEPAKAMFAPDIDPSDVRLSSTIDESSDQFGGSAGIYQSTSWLRTSAETCPGTSAFASNASGFGAVFVVRPQSAGHYGSRAILGSTLADFLNFGKSRREALFLGRTGYTSDLSLAADAKPADSARLFAALSAFAIEKGCKVGVCAFLTRPAVDRLVAAGLIEPEEVILHDGSAVIEADTLRDFPRALSSKRRWTVRRDHRRYTESGLTTRICRLSEASRFSAALAANVARHHGLELANDYSMRHVLDKQSEHLDKFSRVFAAIDADGRAIAFVLAYEYEQTLFVRASGLDYSRSVSTGAYFELAYAETIRWAIEHGLKNVDLGIGALRPKLLRGARLHPRYAVVRKADGRRVKPATAVKISRQTIARLRKDAEPFASDEWESLAYIP